MNKVQEFYEKIQGLVGGNVPWNELDPIAQMHIVQAINKLLDICQMRK